MPSTPKGSGLGETGKPNVNLEMLNTPKHKKINTDNETWQIVLMIATLPTTLLETNIPPARKPSQKETSVFQPSIFWCKLAVSFTDGNLLVVETTAPLARVSGRSFVGGWMELCANLCQSIPCKGNDLKKWNR